MDLAVNRTYPLGLHHLMHIDFAQLIPSPLISSMTLFIKYIYYVTLLYIVRNTPREMEITKADQG